MALARELALGAGVLWEDARWLCLCKPAGLNVLSGRRSLANALRGLQLARGGDGGGSGDSGGGGGGGGGEAWTVAYDGDARVGGAWLIAKGAAGALSLLDGAEEARLCWRAIFKGAPSAAQLAQALAPPGWPAAALAPEVVRVQPSVRYGAVTEATFSLPAAAVDAWQLAAAAKGVEVVGGAKPAGRPRTVHDGPRAACVWVSAVRIVDAQSGRCVGGGDDAEAAGGNGGGCAPPPARFGRLLEMEAAVCSRLADEQRAAACAAAAAGGGGGLEALPEELARQLLVDPGDEAEVEEEAEATDGGSDGASDEAI